MSEKKKPKAVNRRGDVIVAVPLQQNIYDLLSKTAEQNNRPRNREAASLITEALVGEARWRKEANKDKMSYNESLLLWNPAKGRAWSHEGSIEGGEIKIIKFGTQDDPRYDCSGGAAYTAIRNTVHVSDLTILALRDAFRLIVDFGICPKKVHQEFMKVREYADITFDWIP